MVIPIQYRLPLMERMLGSLVAATASVKLYWIDESIVKSGVLTNVMRAYRFGIGILSWSPRV